MTIFEQLQANPQFSHLLRQATADETGNELVIHPANDLDRDWLENRLHSALLKRAEQIAGRPVVIRYEMNGTITPPPSFTPAAPPAEIAHAALYDPRHYKWAKHPLIISRFYPAYFVRRAGRIIGSTCLPLWRHLVDQYDMSKSDKLDWTPAATYQAITLARALGCPVTHLIGRLRTCSVFDERLAEIGAGGECCHHFLGARLGQTQTGRPCCHYRVAGALEVLAGEGWIVARKRGTDSRDTRFEIQAQRYPALMTAAQVGLLDISLQEEYREFLHRDLGLNLGEWEQIERFEVGLSGLTLTESSFLLPYGNKTQYGVKVLLPPGNKTQGGASLLLPPGNKNFFFAHNYCLSASNGSHPADQRGRQAVRKRLNGDIDKDLDKK